MSVQLFITVKVEIKAQARLSFVTLLRIHVPLINLSYRTSGFVDRRLPGWSSLSPPVPLVPGGSFRGMRSWPFYRVRVFQEYGRAILERAGQSRQRHYHLVSLSLYIIESFTDFSQGTSSCRDHWLTHWKLKQEISHALSSSCMIRVLAWSYRRYATRYTAAQIHRRIKPPHMHPFLLISIHSAPSLVHSLTRALPPSL